MSYRNYGYKGGKGKGKGGPQYGQGMDMRDDGLQAHNAVTYCKYVNLYG